MSNFSFAKLDTKFNLLILLAVSFLATVPVWLNGIPNGEDLPHHYQFVFSYREALNNGVLYPSLASQLNYGLGDVGVRFYPPLSHYVLVFFQLIAGNWFDASCLTFVFYFYLGAIGIYFWSKEWFSERAALFAACFYIFIPYRIAQLYNAFLYAEFAACAILPFCFLFVRRVCVRGKILDVCGLAIFYALLILTHLPTSIIGSLALAVYALFSIKRVNFISAVAKLFISVSAGLAASAFYWLRMLTELNFVAHNNERFISADYDFRRHFLVSEIFDRIFNLNNLKIRFIDTVFFITLGIIISCALLYFANLKDKREFKLASIAAPLAFALFMLSPLSLPVWENFTVLQKVQFPWRWMTIISVCGTIFIAAGAANLLDFSKRSSRPLVFLALGLIVVAFAFNFLKTMNPLITYPRAELNQISARLKDSRSNDCWWTVWMNNGAFQIKERAFAGSDRIIEIRNWQPTQKIVKVSAGETNSLILAAIYYPHWRAEVNGISVQVQNNGDGLISVPIPVKESIVNLYFQEPFAVRTASVISVFTWLILIAGIIPGFFINLKNGHRQISG
jgi:uncharacterized membrane protein